MQWWNPTLPAPGYFNQLPHYYSNFILVLTKAQNIFNNSNLLIQPDFCGFVVTKVKGFYTVFNKVDSMTIAMNQFSNRSQLTLKCGKKTKAALEPLGKCVTK